MPDTLIKPTKGRLLVSVPFLNDYYFGRSVILLTEHNDEGSVGLIVNKALDTKVNEAIKDFPDFDAHLFLGGPVETNSLFYIHTSGDLVPDSIEVKNGLFWGGNFDTVRILIENKQLTPNDIKFFVGYAGWGPNQLNRELDEKSWVVTKSEIKNVMNLNLETYWQNKIQDSENKEYTVWANYPINPSLN